MLCAIYKTKRKSGMYLYIETRDNFEPVPELLKQSFGKPEFVMLFNLLGDKPLAQANKQDVLKNIKEKGFYLQMPTEEENLIASLKR